MRAFKAISVLMLLALILSACGGAAPAAPAATSAPAAPAATSAPAAVAGGTLKIAILAPLSGSQPTFGTMTRDGALLAIEDWSKAHNGGVIGMNIKASVEEQPMQR
jgi:ABC-type branched-subunit amino acid transport system substrate-binding protein